MTKSAKRQPARREPSVCVANAEDVVRLHQPTRINTDYALLFHLKNRSLEALTFHKVAHSGGKAPKIMPGRILTPADEASILRMLTRPAAETGLQILPEGTLHLGQDHVVWHVPAQVRPMTIYDGDKGYISQEVYWPNLVFIARHRKLYVAAYLGPERPDAKTALYHCPTGNVYASSEVCLGDCKPPQGAMIQDIPEWNAVMFDSAFSHANHTSAMTGIEVMAYWKQKRKKPTPVPPSAMTPMRLTLDQWHHKVVNT